MRWLWALAVFSVGCLRPVSDGLLDGGASQAVASVPDAGSAPEPYDPCAWDGRGDGLCFADSASVFDGTGCRVVCGAVPRPGLPGVFANSAECAATCPCDPSKFVLFPPQQSGPFALGGFCDELVVIAKGSAAAPWPGLRCEPGGALIGEPTDQWCQLGVRGHALDRRALSAACRASVLPQVRFVGCVVWVD